MENMIRKIFSRVIIRFRRLFILSASITFLLWQFDNVASSRVEASSRVTPLTWMDSLWDRLVTLLTPQGYWVIGTRSVVDNEEDGDGVSRSGNTLGYQSYREKRPILWMQCLDGDSVIELRRFGQSTGENIQVFFKLDNESVHRSVFRSSFDRSGYRVSGEQAIGMISHIIRGHSLLVSAVFTEGGGTSAQFDLTGIQSEAVLHGRDCGWGRGVSNDQIAADS